MLFIPEHPVVPAVAVIVGPAEEPISLADAKQHLRIDAGFTDDDALIGSLITAARQRLEIETRRVFCTQTLRMTLPRFPGYYVNDPTPRHIFLPVAPTPAVTSIQYIDLAGDQQTWAAENWLYLDGEPASIELGFGKIWPYTRCQGNAVQITFTAGYGAAAAVPELVKAAMRLIIGHLYENREEVTASRINQPFEIPRGANAITNLLRWGDYR